MSGSVTTTPSGNSAIKLDSASALIPRCYEPVPACRSSNHPYPEPRRSGFGPAEGRGMTAVTACSACGTALLGNARFCHACGSAITTAEAAAEYKQVTVLFADVVHSMDLAATLGAER